MSRSWCLLALLPLVSGCLAFGGGYEIRFDESLRYPVSFASIEAAGLFHEGLGRASRKAFKEGGGFGILFVFGHGGGVFHETEMCRGPKCVSVSTGGLGGVPAGRSVALTVLLFADLLPAASFAYT